MSYRITDKKGKTIGYAKDQGSELLGMIIGGTVLLSLAVIIAPIIAVLAGISLLIPWYLIFWGWATRLPLTPFPNLNGVLAIVGMGIAGGLLVRYVRIHRILLYSLGHIVGLVGATLLVAFCTSIVLIIIGLALGLLMVAIAWLFSTDIPFAIVAPLVLRLSTIVDSPWFAPLLFPVGWACAWIISIFDKHNMLGVTLNFTPAVGLDLVPMAIVSWAGMLLTHVVGGVEGVSLLAFGPLLGAALWGIAKGVYKIVIRGEKGDLNEYLGFSAT